MGDNLKCTANIAGRSCTFVLAMPQNRSVDCTLDPGGPSRVHHVGPSPSRMKAKSRITSLILHFIILFLAAVLRKKAFQYSPVRCSSLCFCANVAASIEVVSAWTPRLGNSYGTLSCFLGLCFLSCMDAFINKCRDPA